MVSNALYPSTSLTVCSDGGFFEYLTSYHLFHELHRFQIRSRSNGFEDYITKSLPVMVDGVGLLERLVKLPLRVVAGLLAASPIRVGLLASPQAATTGGLLASLRAATTGGLLASLRAAAARDGLLEEEEEASLLNSKLSFTALEVQRVK